MSQKVKEIEVWVDPKSLNRSLITVSTYKDDGDIKCTLLVPVEEKKVTISESEFDEAWRDLTYFTGIETSWVKRIEELKQKLFSGNGG